ITTSGLSGKRGGVWCVSAASVLVAVCAVAADSSTPTFSLVVIPIALNFRSPSCGLLASRSHVCRIAELAMIVLILTKLVSLTVSNIYVKGYSFWQGLFILDRRSAIHEITRNDTKRVLVFFV